MRIARGPCCAVLACLSLATCCPTLWLQVTKTDPAPWPEVPTPAVRAPAIPAIMPNRFDVLEGGKLARLAEAFRDAVDPRDDRLAQEASALTALESVLTRYGDRRLTTCAGATTKGTVSCTVPDGKGLDANCNALIVDQVPAAHAMVIAGGQARTVISASMDPDSKKPILALGERIDAADGAPIDVCFVDAVVLSRPLLSFVHMSDIQLRDPSVVLTDRRLSKRLDWFEELNSFEYDEDLAFYNQYLFESMVATINAAARPAPGRKLGGDPERPSFVIHTGDSVDANAMSELRRFHTVIDRLQIPFYELFGNHDVLVFGNLTPTDQTADANDKKCAPVATLIGSESRLAPNKICVDARVKPCANCTAQQVELIASTEGHAATRQRFIAGLEHDTGSPVAEPPELPVGAYCADTKPRILNAAYSRAHGF
ncbi:MAG TPA: metallophosphoesterase, partial [Kofleriaceae bacterium]|nr:metallophosphoesterase [Kofleriaceae bacterium]